MKSTESQARNDERRVDDPHSHGEEQRAAAAQKARTAALFVDPSDLRSEPQPEEPGYGHGV